MSTTNNERSSQSPLRVGLIVSEEALAQMGPAVQACPLLELAGQAGMLQKAGLPDVPWFDDTRVLIGQPGIEAVILTASTRSDIELARTAAERGVHVWRPPPLARSFAEATEVAGQVKRSSTVYRVASWWEHVVDHGWQELDWPDGFTPLHSDLRVSTRGPALKSWRSSASEAAGGVLASAGYALLEALVAVRGLPQDLTAAIGKHRQDPNGATRETEDTAIALLRYAAGGTAVVGATWDQPPTAYELAHHGQAVTVTLNEEEVRVLDSEGAIRDQRALTSDYLASELRRFAEQVRGDARDRAAAAIERHLAVSAVLETVYLAARTNHPESPHKLYDVQGWPVPRQ